MTLVSYRVFRSSCRRPTNPAILISLNSSTVDLDHSIRQVLKRDDLVDYALRTAAIVHDGREHSGRLLLAYELPWLVDCLSAFRGQSLDSLKGGEEVKPVPA